MIGLPYTLATVAALLVLIGLLQPVAARLNVAFTVLLAALGVCLGIGAGFLLHTELTDRFNTLAELLLDFPITSQGFLFIFLPILLFEAALAIDVRRMLDDAAPIFLLAVVAVLVTTAIVGLALWPATELSLVVCLLLGSIVATTDPAAVIAIFRDVGAPVRLTRLVEGESLLNDAAAIAVFTVLLGLLRTGAEVSFGSAAAMFVVSFAGGALVGVIGGRAVMSLIPRLRDSRLAETTLTLALPYLVYIASERVFGVSGVVAVVAAGLVVSALGTSRFAPQNRVFLHDVWQQLAFWASSLVFILAAMLVPRLMVGAELYDLLLVSVVALAALVARALVLFGLLPALSAVRLAARVSHRYKAVILWGGLRGAVTLALALAVTENRAIGADVQRFVAILATGYVLLTLFVNGTTLRPVLHLLKLDRLSPLDRAIRDQVLALSLGSVADAIRATASGYHLGAGPTRDVLEAYERRAAEVREGPDAEHRISDRELITLGLVALAVRERELILEHFRYRTVSRRILERLLADAERIIEGARSAGRVGYNRAARRQVTFGPVFRLAHALHRRLGIDRALIVRLADRFELLLVSRMVLEELTPFITGKLAPVVGDRATGLLCEIIDARRTATSAALDALRLQYPTYADDLERRFLRQSALRLEAAEYDSLYAEGLIGQELYNHLRSEVQARRARAARRPHLDLGLEVPELVRQFPLFAALSPAQLDQISARLRPRFAVPGERLIRRGERGDAMYLISSGAVEVAVEKERIRLGRGDFFGELAILGDRRRQADVTALGYCQLLVLRAEDLQALAATDPSIRTRIDRVAADRTAMNRALRRAG